MMRFASSLSLTITALMASIPGARLAGQELVANGGFEVVSKVPATYDQLALAPGWSAVTLGLPEVFDRSANARKVGIPVNAYGETEPFEGERYAGFVAWKDDQRGAWGGAGDDPFKPGWSVYSEYMSTPLVSPLEEGVEYEVVFQVRLGANSDRAVSGIGACFTEAPIGGPHRRFLKEKPQVSADGIVRGKEQWVGVQGRFVADGGERHLTIGVFPSAEFDTERTVEGTDNQYAYYFIDAITVKRVADR